MSTQFRLTVVRNDGISHTSDFFGWSSETAMIHFSNEARKDKRTLSIFVFEAKEGVNPNWALRSANHKDKENG